MDSKTLGMSLLVVFLMASSGAVVLVVDNRMNDDIEVVEEVKQEEIEEVEKQKKRMERFKIEVPMPEEILFPGSTSRQNVPAPSPQSSSPPPKNALERARERAKQSKGRTIPRFFDADSMKF